jgi:hypothetical protein
MERFNLKKLNEAEGIQQYHVEVSTSFAALEDLDTEMEITSAYETITENTESQPERRQKFGHKNRKQIVQKCITVQIFMNNSNKSKFYSGGK